MFNLYRGGIPNQQTRIPLSLFVPHSHVQTIKRHPRSPIRLTQSTTIRNRLGAIERADIVEPEEPAFEDVLPVSVFAVHPLS